MFVAILGCNVLEKKDVIFSHEMEKNVWQVDQWAQVNLKFKNKVP